LILWHSTGEYKKHFRKLLGPYLKGPSHQIIFAWKWYGYIGLGEALACDRIDK
jgi:hypothetical protein